MPPSDFRACIACGERQVRCANVEFSFDFPHDGKTHHISAMEVPAFRCEACGETTYGPEAQPVMRAAVRRQLGLLSPEEVRANRKALLLRQPELAELLGCSTAWLSRLEKDRLVHSRAYDRMLRVFFELPQVRDALTAIASGSSGIGRRIRTDLIPRPFTVYAVNPRVPTKEAKKVGSPLLAAFSSTVSWKTASGSLQQKDAA